jgi:DNA-binding NarL/FixJ family response regulator
MDGLQVAMALQKVKCRAKIILLTLQEDPEVITASLAAGVLSYVTKPGSAGTWRPQPKKF